MPNSEKDIKRLSRKELLEMLILQTRKVEELEDAIASLNNKLESKKLQIDSAGNIAEASLLLNGIFDSAQKAADQYLENIRSIEEEKKSLLEEARIKADETIKKAENEADLIISEAKNKADLILSSSIKKAKPKTKKKK